MIYKSKTILKLLLISIISKSETLPNSPKINDLSIVANLLIFKIESTFSPFSNERLISTSNFSFLIFLDVMNTTVTSNKSEVKIKAGLVLNPEPFVKGKGIKTIIPFFILCI